MSVEIGLINDPAVVQRLERVWGPTDLGLALEVHNLQVRAFEHSDTFDPRLDRYITNHTTYLSETAATMDWQTVGANSTATSCPLDREDDRALFALHGGVLASPLDLVSLGLPEFDDPSNVGEQSPIAVAVHDRPGSDGPEAVELLLWDGEAFSSRFLENMSAALDGEGRPNGAQWVNPGDRELYRRGTKGYKWEQTKPRIGRDGISRSMLTIAPADADDTRTRIVRASSNKAERIVAAERQRDRKGGKIARWVGAFVAGAAVALTPVEADDPDKNRETTTAEQMVVSPDIASQDDGQAERFFDEGTLSRSRRAFDTYLRGDTQELEGLVEDSGYESNWVDPQAVLNIHEAQTPGALEDAFAQAFKDIPISLKVCDNQESVAFLDESVGYRHKPVSNLDYSRQTALEIVEFWNRMDKDFVQSLEPLRYYTVHSVDEYNPGDDSADDLAGYYIDAHGDNPRSIVLETDTTKVQGNSKDWILFHENTHYLDSILDGQLGRRAEALNPQGHSYAGHEGYASSSTSYGGERVTTRNYGNVSAGEDAAVTGEVVLDEAPSLTSAESALSEKQMALILALEESQPGFTASLLLRADINEQSAFSAVLAEVNYLYDNYGRFAGVPIAASALAVLIARATSRQRRRSVLRSYGA